MCRFLDAGNNEALRTLSRPASKKRQGTKSREVGHRRCSGRYGDLMAALSSMVDVTLPECRPADHTGEIGSVQWASRQALGTDQRVRAASTTVSGSRGIAAG